MSAGYDDGDVILSGEYLMSMAGIAFRLHIDEQERAGF
jgi:hypothetical protein